MSGNKRQKRFTNEDHLTVHRKKHEMCLSLNVESDNAKSSNISLFVDQTPTPTRFIRNCEEVGLFQDLQNMNPFEEHFRKATEAGKTGQAPAHSSLRVTTPDNDILNTPSILPSDLENENHNHHLHVRTLSESDNSNGDPVEILSQRRDGEDAGAASDDEDRGGIGLLNMQEEDDEVEEDAASQLVRRNGSSCDVIMDDSNATSNSMMAASLSPGTMSPASVGPRGSVTAASNGTTILTQAMMTPICSSSFVMGESSNLSILPTTDSFPCEFISVPAYTKNSDMSNVVFSLPSSLESDYITVPSKASASAASNVGQPVRKIVKQVSSTLMPAVTNSAATTTTHTPMLQLILRLPDGSSVPVNIPSVPAVTSAASVSVQQVVPPIFSGVQDAHSKTTASFAKLKLKQTLANSQVITSNGSAVKLYNERQVLTASDCLNLDSASNDSDSHSYSSKRQRLDDDDEEKRKKFLERNRAAATRCRQKRKQWVQSLEGKADELSGVNQQLQNEVAMLRNEVAHLKSMLLAHKDCPVTQQQQRKMTQRNGAPVGSTVIVANPANTGESIQLSAAEAIASSALTNMGQSSGPSGSQSPVVLHTFMSREQAVALLNYSGTSAGSKTFAIRRNATATATAAPSEVVTIDQALVQLDDEMG